MIATLFILLFFLNGGLYGQEVIENSKTPLNPDRDRVIELEEVMRISDDTGDFYFQWTFGPRIAPDGGFFVKARDQFLQFNPEGRFMRNLFKKGQGPEEMLFIGNFCPEESHILLHCTGPPKVMHFDYEGNLKHEFRLREKSRMLDFLVYSRGRYYFIEHTPVLPEKKEEVLDASHHLVSYPDDGGDEIRHDSFLTKMYIVVGEGGGRGMISLTSLLAAEASGRFIFITNTADYEICQFDVESNRVIRRFGRKYQKVKSSNEDRKSMVVIDGKNVMAPSRKHKNDIHSLFVVGDNLWVQTSTVDEKKGAMFDVFDFHGRYLDRFYLKSPGKIKKRHFHQMTTSIREGILLTIESDEDGLTTLVQYKMIGL